MLDRRYFEGMSELEELAKGALVVPLPEGEREEADEMTRRTIEMLKKRKLDPEHVKQSRHAT